MKIMIKFSLKCAHGHNFDSWFRSSNDFNTLDQSNMLACPVCGSNEVKKNIMTPQVQASSEKKSLSAKASPNLSAPLLPAEKAVLAFRKFVEKKCENVGPNFVDEARSMHEGSSPKRSIVGEATKSDALSLLEEGIPVAPVPWSDSHKSN